MRTTPGSEVPARSGKSSAKRPNALPGLTVMLLLGGFAMLGAGETSAGENITWDGNVLWNNSNGFANNEGPTATCNNQAPVLGNSEYNTLFGSPFTHNRIVNPGLINLSLSWNFRPTVNSPVFCANFHPVVTVPADGWFTQTTYAGALDADPANDWTTGWTTKALNGDPADYNLGKPLVVLAGHLPTQTLVNTNNYLVQGRCFVDNGSTLTIQAGTALFGSVTITPSFLEIDRGGKLIAIGTSAQPIIFTSQNATNGTAIPGDWAGVVWNGRACANCAATDMGDSCAFETGNGGYYGGTDPHYNGGIMRYTRIEFSGFAVAPNQELNCLTMNSLGDSTLIDHVQAHRGFDDLFEFFGGTVDCRYLIGTWGDDDGFDFQMGTRGRLQFGIIQQNPANTTPNVDKGIEADNNEFNFGATLCRSNPTFANLTLIGTREQDPSTTRGAQGVHFRRGAHGTIINSIIQGFRQCAFNYDDDATVAAGFGANGTVYCSGTSGTGDGIAPNVFEARAFPNPFQRSSRISFSLPATLKTAVKIFAIDGRLVDTVADRDFAGGVHDLEWTAPASLSNGLYFYTVSAGPYQTRGKLVLAR